MARKKWTPKTEVNDSLLQFREKRKWQIALRRYVLEKNKSSYYAPYFGLDIEKFREWIEVQFDETLSWDNFSLHWQFEHVVPVVYFDFQDDRDLRLCWNFVNIRVEKNSGDKIRNHRVDLLAAKKYFQALFEQTGYSICGEMVAKISLIETTELADNSALLSFIRSNKEYIDAVKDFRSEDFDRLNTGTTLQSLLFEKDFLKRLGS